ncbi:hypothetical protein SNUCP2_10550 [Clostridium perfringens A]
MDFLEKRLLGVIISDTLYKLLFPYLLNINELVLLDYEALPMVVFTYFVVTFFIIFYA